MEQNYNVITNLFIGITYLFSIILIIDELYNIGFFTFNYTYQFNYGSFTSKFNNIQTIECETSRFNVYNNIKFLYKDIFNKSYFNYLLLIAATLITILCCIAYAVYFYFKFIIEQPDECSFTEDSNLSFPKQLLKCLCDECHKLLPNCTGNYFVVFVLLIIIPLSYIFKTLFNINFTPNSNNALFGFIYICIFILLIFYYSFNLFNRKTENKYKDLIIHSLFTIIFISSGYIYRYIYSKYNNINLNSSNDNTTIYDIYKQTLPIKPNPIQKPLYKGSDLLSTFKYNDNDKDPEYKIKKTIVDDYYKSIKSYDTDMKNYNIRFNAYNNSLTSTKLGDKTNYFDITINILGLNNYMHIYLIILIIISLIIYNIYKDDISYVCFIYALTLLIALTIMNSILYYNTYINKYVIYEPMAHYKNDITNANTALNLELNPSSGLVFYNKLINNDKSLLTETNSEFKDVKEILEDIKKLKDIKLFTSDNLQAINDDIINYKNFQGDISTSSSEYNQINNAVFLYKKITGSFPSEIVANIASGDDPIIYLFDNCIDYIKSISGNIKIEHNKIFTFKYSKTDIKLQINMVNYYRYYYYYAYQYKFILEGINPPFLDANLITITKLKDSIYRIIKLLEPYKEPNVDSNTYMIETSIKTNINSIGFAFNAAKLTILQQKISNINKNIINQINITRLINSITITQNIPLINIDFEDTRSFIKYAAASDYVYSNALKKYNIININNKEFLNKETNYNELPFKIIDNKDDEYYLELKSSKIMVYIKYVLTAEEQKNISDYKINSKYTKGNELINTSYNASDINTFNKDLATTFTNEYSIPFIFYKKTANTSKIELFKKIILAVLFNSICNIQYKFTNPAFLPSIKNQQTTTAYKAPVPQVQNEDGLVIKEGSSEVPVVYYPLDTYFVLNSEIIINYIDKFKQDFIKENYKIGDNDLSNITVPVASAPASVNIFNFFILIFNSYNVSNKDIKKNISANILNLINHSNNISFSDEIIHIITNITTNQYFLEENIKKDEKNMDEDISKLYNNNKLVINLIIILFENLFIIIKKEISTNIPILCFNSTESLANIEKNLYTYISGIANTQHKDDLGKYNTILFNKSISKLTIEGKSINNIDKYIRNYFNIVIFLLDNLKLNTNTAEIDAITTNYNFYNRDDNIKSTIQKRLIISCDYKSKYNNMDSKQLSYFKINADNVNYNFPILMIIFLIILGEPIFIKS